MFSISKVATAAVDTMREFLSSASMSTSELLASQKDSFRVYGLRRLARSGCEEDVDRIITFRSSDPSPLVKATAEKVMLTLSQRHPSLALTFAENISLSTVLGRSINQLSHEQAQPHWNLIGKLLCCVQMTDHIESRIIAPIVRLHRQRMAEAERIFDEAEAAAMIPRDQGAEELSDDELDAMFDSPEAWAFLAPEFMREMDAITQIQNEKLQFTQALMHIPGSQADTFRCEMVPELEPDDFAWKVLDAFLPGVVGSEVVTALVQMRDRWILQLHYGSRDHSLDDVRAAHEKIAQLEQGL